jgi:transketolase C-terminal domain/subunit
MKPMRDVWGDTLVALGKTNPNVLVLDAALSQLNEGGQICKGFSGAIAFRQIADIQRTVFDKEV